jgi:glycosyltransferase involved in cell wall biosynthesis
MKDDRIIHVPRRFVSHEWGGTETVILETSKQQKASGYDPQIITSMALADQSKELIQGVPVSRFSHIYPFFGLSQKQKMALDKKGGNLLSLSLLRGLCQVENTRIFHAHALKRLGGTVRTAAKLKKKPYVVSLHGGSFDVPSDDLQTLIDPIKGKIEWGKPFGALLGSRQVLTEANHVICVGQNEADTARKELPHDRISYLPNGVDFKRFSVGDKDQLRDRLGIAESDFLVLSIGRIDTQKNQLCLLKAFRLLHKEHSDARLVLVGPVTQPDYLAKLQSYIEEHELSESVHFLSLENDDPLLVNAYHAADVFALASRHEPFGIVVLEAWCAGCPVIASRVGGLKTLITDEQNGLFFDVTSGQPEQELATQIFKLHANRSLANGLGEAGKRNAQWNYDWSVINARLEDIYQLAEEHHRTPHK